MIDEEGQRTIRRLARQGLFEAEIVRQTGYSRNAVRRYMKQGRKIITPVQRLAKLIKYPLTSNTPYGICPLCHNRVTMPCRACLTRMYNAKTTDPVPMEVDLETDDAMLEIMKDGVTLGVNLKRKEYQRYLKIKERKDRERRERERLKQVGNA